MTIDPTKKASAASTPSTPATSGTSGTNKPAAACDVAKIGKELTARGVKRALIAAGNMPETPGEKTGGVIFAEGTLKKLETKEERFRDEEGVFETRTFYMATLTDGTVVKYEKQEPLSDKSGGFKQPQIRKNKDGSFDFEGLRKVYIIDTKKNDNYNIIGCDNVYLDARRGNDKDKIELANIRMDDGTIVRNEDIHIEYNKGDKVPSYYLTGDVKENDGMVHIHMPYDDGMSYEQAEEANPRAVDVQYIENERKLITETAYDGSNSFEFYSHDGKKLRKDYVAAKEQVLADGYKIKTSPDGKTQWFYTPDGKAISKAEFKNRGLQ